MSERDNPIARAIEVVMQIEKGWRVLPKRTYRAARETIAEALRTAYAEGFLAGRQRWRTEGRNEGPTDGSEDEYGQADDDLPVL